MGLAIYLFVCRQGMVCTFQVSYSARQWEEERPKNVDNIGSRFAFLISYIINYLYIYISIYQYKFVFLDLIIDFKI